jgi:hypothetical protein
MERNILSQVLSVVRRSRFCGEGVVKMNQASGKLAAVLTIAGLLILLNVPIHGVQMQPLSEPVDVAVTCITNVNGMLIYFCGKNRTSGTNVPINVTAARLDSNGLVPSVEVNLTLNRMNVATSENVTISNSTVLLAPGANSTVQFLWNETLHTLSAGNYDVYAFADIGPGDIYDTNMTNNIGIGGRVRVVVTKEDINGNGYVDIFDAILLSNPLGTKLGDKRWNPDADLMPDGVVDWFDWLMLARMFNWNLGNSAFEPHPIAWNLTISTPLGQTQNDTVVILSNYIVYNEYSFNTTLKQLSFNIASSIDGFCNVSIPATSMSGAFTVYLDDVPTPSVITSNVPGDLSFWNGYAEGADYLNINATRYFIYFNSTGLSQKVRIVSEYADEIPGDINHDGTVNILDAITLATHYNWRNP